MGGLTVEEEKGARALYRDLAESGVLGDVGRLFLLGEGERADVMLMCDGFVRRYEAFRDLEGYLRGAQRGLVGFHLGACYDRSVLLRRQDGFSAAYRVLTLDFDVADRRGELRDGQALMVGLIAHAAVRCFTRGGDEGRALVCFTGGGWHVYLADERLGFVGREDRARLVRGIDRRRLFFFRDGAPVRSRLGHMVFAAGLRCRGGDLFRVDAETGEAEYYWRSSLDVEFLAGARARFLEAARARQGDWLAPAGPVASALHFFAQAESHDAEPGGGAVSAETLAELRSLVADVDNRRTYIMSALLERLARVSDGAESRGDPGWLRAPWLCAVVMVACAEHDCGLAGLTLDHAACDMQHMVRGPLSYKPGSMVSLPLGSPSEAFALPQAERELPIERVADGAGACPRLAAGIRRLREWCARYWPAVREEAARRGLLAAAGDKAAGKAGGKAAGKAAAASAAAAGTSQRRHGPRHPVSWYGVRDIEDIC